MQTRVCILFGSTTACYSNSTCSCVALSTAESEYIAACSCAQEVMFFRQLASSIGIELSGPTTVFSDSQSALAMVVNPTNARSKAIDIKYHYVRGCVKSMNIRFKFIPTLHQQADLLTKSLPSPAVTTHPRAWSAQGLLRSYSQW